MGDGQRVDPVCRKLLSHLGVLANVGFLELDNFTNAGDCVVSCVMELSCFSFLFVNLSSHFKFNCEFKGLKAMISLGGESMTSVCCNNANTVGSCLSETSALVGSEAADCLNDHCVVSGRKVVGSKMFNHVIKDEKTKLFALLNFAAERFVESCLA